MHMVMIKPFRNTHLKHCLVPGDRGGRHHYCQETTAQRSLPLSVLFSVTSMFLTTTMSSWTLTNNLLYSLCFGRSLFFVMLMKYSPTRNGRLQDSRRRLFRFLCLGCSPGLSPSLYLSPASCLSCSLCVLHGSSVEENCVCQV